MFLRVVGPVWVVWKSPMKIQKKHVPTIVKSFPSVCGHNEGWTILRELASLLDELYQPRVILDLSQSTLTGPTDVDVLLRCVEQILAKDGEVALAAPLPQTRLVLELTRIDRVAQVFDSVEDAKSGPGGAVRFSGEDARIAGRRGTRWAA